MATRQRISADFTPRLPGRTRAGSQASFRKASTVNARQDMAAIIRRYEEFLKDLKAVTPTVLYNAMQPVFNQSQVYVPKKTGALMESGHLEVGTDEQGRAEARITYGSEDVPYAAVVHEFTWLNHAPPTRAKYLQSAMEEEMDAFLTSIAVDYATMMGMV